MIGIATARMGKAQLRHRAEQYTEKKSFGRAWRSGERQSGAMERRSRELTALPQKNTKTAYKKGGQEMNDVEMRVKLTFTEDILGTASANPELHEEYIASKAPDAQTREEEVEALGANEVFEKGMTVFPRNEDGVPFLWDYQIKGFFKDSCKMLRKVQGSVSSKIKAYKQEIDGLIFINEREIPFDFDGDIEICQRPLRAQTAQGERIALSSSESIPAGASITFTIRCKVGSDLELVREWLDYGKDRGIGQWRNSGKGRFTWEEVQA